MEVNMREELDEMLCQKYPKMLVNRHAPMQQTAMCWGFACGDGWFNLLDRLMSNIQHHIDWRNDTRSRNIAFNQAVIDARRHPADWTKFDAIYKNENWHTIQLRESIIDGSLQLLDVVPEVEQVVLDQVKEKFGTLRFYYSGGDDVIDGMVRMAESMSGCICETCGDAGKVRHGGWIRTLCDKHEQEHQSKNESEE